MRQSGAIRMADARDTDSGGRSRLESPDAMTRLQMLPIRSFDYQ